MLPTSSLVRRDAAAGSPDSYELAIAAPSGAQFEVAANSGNVILSPDGTRIAFVASTDKAATIWIRSLAADDARSVPGTENAFNPFWSPDGRSIGFFANGKVWAVKVAGGLPESHRARRRRPGRRVERGRHDHLCRRRIRPVTCFCFWRRG